MGNILQCKLHNNLCDKYKVIVCCYMLHGRATYIAAMQICIFVFFRVKINYIYILMTSIEQLLEYHFKFFSMLDTSTQMLAKCFQTSRFIL